MTIQNPPGAFARITRKRRMDWVVFDMLLPLGITVAVGCVLAGLRGVPVGDTTGGDEMLLFSGMLLLTCYGELRWIASVEDFAGARGEQEDVLEWVGQALLVIGITMLVVFGVLKGAGTSGEHGSRGAYAGIPAGSCAFALGTVWKATNRTLLALRRLAV